MLPFPIVDLPEAERHAMRIDGELYALADRHLPLDVPESPASRAAALLGGRSPRLIAARLSAAWVWGVTPSLPSRPEFLVDAESRWRPSPGQSTLVTESVIRPGDVTTLAGVHTTTPLRTALDLARFIDDFTPAHARLVSALADIGGFALDDALGAMDRGRNLFGKRSAAERLRRALEPQPELTR